MHNEVRLLTIKSMEPKDYPANIDEGSTKHAQVSTARGKRKKKKKIIEKGKKNSSKTRSQKYTSVKLQKE